MERITETTVVENQIKWIMDQQNTLMRTHSSYMMIMDEYGRSSFLTKLPKEYQKHYDILQDTAIHLTKMLGEYKHNQIKKEQYKHNH